MKRETSGDCLRARICQMQGDVCAITIKTASIFGYHTSSECGRGTRETNALVCIKLRSRGKEDFLLPDPFRIPIRTPRSNRVSFFLP